MKVVWCFQIQDDNCSWKGGNDCKAYQMMMVALAICTVTDLFATVTLALGGTMMFDETNRTKRACAVDSNFDMCLSNDCALVVAV